MNSIRQRLIVALVMGFAVILALGGCGIYLFTRAVLLRDLDMVIRSAAPEVTRTLRAQLMEGLPGSEVESKLTRESASVQVEAWTADGRVVYRSASLQNADLPFSKTPRLDVKLPDGHNARTLVLTTPLDVNGRIEVLTQARLKARDEGAATTHLTEQEHRLRELPASIIVMIARDRTGLDATLRILSLVLWGVGLLMLLLTVAVVMFVGSRGLAPLHRVGEQASRIDASKLDFRFPTNDLPAELKSICERLNDLLSRLEASFTRERCFSADVAHELRTPITELRTLAEVALKWPTPDPVTAGAFRDTLDAALQMQTIVESLLAIARCEASIQVIVREPVALADLVRTTWQTFAAEAAHKNLRVQIELADVAPIETDRSMLGLVLTNLFSNAVEYTPPEGQVHIRLRDARNVDLSVINSVENIASEDLPHLFERFWRKDTARSSSKHSGIGLSVSQAYARALGLNLNAHLLEKNVLEMRLSDCRPVS
jgi:signal transduction histidine kinase